MPATPAWPPKSLPRLFVDMLLSLGRDITLDGGQVHYLRNVMRLGEGDEVILCDDISGEYRALITAMGKRHISLNIAEHLRGRENVPDLWLCAAPVKKDRWYWLAEKACELGIYRLQPVRTQRTIIDRVKPEKLRAHMVEAAEQCERTALPELAEMRDLDSLLNNWPKDRHLFFADERLHEAGNSASAFNHMQQYLGPAAILIGPEGGFTDEENAKIKNHDNAVPISLGPRILRAETAALATISIWMAARGDWPRN